LFAPHFNYTKQRFKSWYIEFKDLLWKSELHVFFLGYRFHPHGKFNVDFRKVFNSKCTSEDFLRIFTPDYLGSLYKIISHFYFQRPIPANISIAQISGYLSQADMPYYIGLAKYHLDDAFGSSCARKEANVHIIGAFYRAFHDGPYNRKFYFLITCT
jgi:hypothetical protein